MENIIVECSCQQNNLWTIITTIVPILVAIAVPCLIARKQNKITLYEKRFECYQRLESLKSFFLYVKEISSFVASPEQGKDAAASAYEEELLQKKDAFVSEFETVLEYESRLEKKMKIETGCKVRPIKKEKKSDGNSKTTNDMR